MQTVPYKFHLTTRHYYISTIVCVFLFFKVQFIFNTFNNIIQCSFCFMSMGTSNHSKEQRISWCKFSNVVYHSYLNHTMFIFNILNNVLKFIFCFFKVCGAEIHFSGFFIQFFTAYNAFK